MHGTLKISSVMEELESGVFFTQNTFIQENLEVESFDFFRDLFFRELCHVQRIHQLVNGTQHQHYEIHRISVISV